MKNQEVKLELQRIGIKNTQKKALILEVMKNLQAPINANELHLKCSEVLKMDIATIYRTLQQFREKEIVREFLGNDGIINYEYVGITSRTHPHFQCEKCHDVICLGELGFDDALYFSNMAGHHKVKSINITLGGLCEKCDGTINNQGEEK